MRNLADQVNYCVSLSISKKLVLSSSRMSMRKFSMQESRESTAKQKWWTGKKTRGLEESARNKNNHEA